MSASPPFEYRHRYLLHSVIFVLGFTTPWNYWLHIDPRGPNAHVWGLLSIGLTQMGAGTIAVAFNAVLALAILCAVAAAWLRTWGAAYLGGGVVQSENMHTAGTVGIIEAGPYRYVRNPLYLGTILHTLALALLMPRSGAIFVVVTIILFQFRLIQVEEKFLNEQLGPPYAAYCGLVPRMVPALQPRITGRSLVPRWGQAWLTEIYMWCVAVAFAVLGWRYSAVLLMQGVVVALGVSLVARAVVPSASKSKNLPA